jgi:hypothetical protein
MKAQLFFLSATPDFGSGTLPGADRWLGIAVRANGGGNSNTVGAPSEAIGGGEFNTADG